MDQEVLAAVQGPYTLPGNFFTAPNHHMARLLRDMFADDNVGATMAVRTWAKVCCMLSCELRNALPASA